MVEPLNMVSASSSFVRSSDASLLVTSDRWMLLLSQTGRRGATIIRVNNRSNARIVLCTSGRGEVCVVTVTGVIPEQAGSRPVKAVLPSGGEATVRPGVNGSDALPLNISTETAAHLRRAAAVSYLFLQGQYGG